jgi:6-phosphogluconate dehydrogenase
MQFGMIGLGRMGANMSRRLMRAGHTAVVYDRSAEAIAKLATEGATGASTLEEFVEKLAQPRVICLMVPAAYVDASIESLVPLLASGDTIIDGGNSHFKDDVRRARSLASMGIHYVDAGTSGGVWGLERGYCLMIGGSREAFDRLEPIFRSLAPGRGSVEPAPGRQGRTSTAEEGFLHCGPSGAGHFVKMIHNGIEYGLMQAYAEGFDIMRHAASEELPPEHRFSLDLADVAEVWRRGSVVTSWLLDLTASALAENPSLSNYTGFVQDSGEGRWTIMAAVEEAVPADVLSAALYTRFRSRKEHTFAEKILSAMRHKFGGHVEKPKE